ncbi:MAG: Jag N-terminal domain-containing protein [Armatimonadetes bacterium]|nr:Jag N-terminal domain-containing protein [Armatimonadota bacterium]
MEKIEASGRTLEEALQLAAQKLGVTIDALDYEIIEQGSKGFLGIGQTPTVIKAWLREEIVTTPVSDEKAAVEESEGIEKETPEAAVSEEKSEEKKEKEGLTDMLLRTLNEILKPMGVNVRPVLKSDTPEEVVIDLVGPDVAILIGKRGQTLDALQYLLGIIASRRMRNKKRIILDAENYRDRHRAMLERKAREYAAAVKAEGKEAVLEPQPARDRRIIHLALLNDPDVYTYSEGEGDERHVVISPKR